MKTRLLTTLTALLIALSSLAKGIEIGGIYYLLDSETMTASVTERVFYDEYGMYITGYEGSITIPASVNYGGSTYSVTSIGRQAFAYSHNLTSVTIPNSVTSIGRQAFEMCSLTSITIPNSVTSIGESAFAECESLTSITIPNSVTYIENDAFRGCYSLKNIKLSNSITAIYATTFASCPNLESIDIPNSVTAIYQDAFAGTGITSITLPNSLDVIGSGAFRFMQITSIEIPNSVTSIGSEAFYMCNNLTSVTIPNSVTNIGKEAFYIYPDEELGQHGLKDIYLLHTDAEAYNCNTYAFEYDRNAAKAFDNEFITVKDGYYHQWDDNDNDYHPYNTCTLHVPAGSTTAYASTRPWSKFKRIVDDLTGIEPIALTPSEAGATYYTLQGQRIGQPQSGIVIVRYSDGSSRKMYVR